MAAWRDARIQQVAPVSARRELIVLGAMFTHAIRELGWMSDNPMKRVQRPATSAPRRRGIPQPAIAAIVAQLQTMRVGPQVALMLELSIETAMRLSEIAGLTWEHVAEKKVRLAETKNGEARDVPLSARAREIISLRRDLDPVDVFTLSPHVVSKTFQRARDAAGWPDVHFHDARSEAITRLSKRLDVMQLARMIGHRDLRSLMVYYAERAEDIADRL